MPLAHKLLMLSFAALLLVLASACGAARPLHHTSSLSTFTLGETPQTIAVEGNPQRPIILFLHGGGLPWPGVASRDAFETLKEDYLLVFWDQRGVGLSAFPEGADEDWRMERYVEDVIELTEHLMARYDKAGIFLVGHSWGSMIGVEAIARRPELFDGYVGIAQQVHLQESDRLTFEALSRRASAQGDEALRSDLEQLGAPPYRRVEDWLTLRELVARQGGLVTGRGQMGLLGMVRCMMDPFIWNFDYPWFEVFQVQPRMEHAIARTYKDMLDFDISRQRRLEVPVTLIHGRDDLNASPELARRWVESLEAPRHRFVVFEDSAHMPLWEEPARFERTLREAFNDHDRAAPLAPAPPAQTAARRIAPTGDR